MNRSQIMSQSQTMKTNRQVKHLGDLLGINRVVMALSVARLGDAIGSSILIVVIPLYVAQLPAPWFPLPESVRVGILISLFGLLNAIMQPLMGAVSDRLGKRKLLILFGLIIMALATLGFIVASRYIDMVFLRILQGVGVGVTVPASMALMTTATQKPTRGSAMGFFSTMRLVGFAAGPLIGGFLYDHFGFTPAFIAGALFILVGILLVLLWVEDSQDDNSVEAGQRLRFLNFDLLTAGIVGAALATFVMASDFSMISALENQFNSRLNQSAFSFGLAFSSLMLGRLVFQVPLGRLSDRLGRKPLIVVGLLLMAPTTALLGYVATTVQFTGLRLFQGLASAAIAAPAFALAADTTRVGGEGRQMSIVTMGFGFGIALGPLLAGTLAVYSFALPFLVGAILSLLVAFVVFRFVPETVTRHQDASSREHSSPYSAEGD